MYASFQVLYKSSTATKSYVISLKDSQAPTSSITKPGKATAAINSAAHTSETKEDSVYRNATKHLTANKINPISL